MTHNYTGKIKKLFQKHLLIKLAQQLARQVIGGINV